MTVRICLVGAGRIGAHHAGVLARHVPGAQVVAVVDPRSGVADQLGAALGARGETDPAAGMAVDDVDAVVIAASSAAHVDLIEAAAKAGKHVFCEKPAGMSLAEIDRARTATAEAGVAFQVGFNRRFAPDFVAAHNAVTTGRIGSVRLMRSLTRDPGEGLADPGAIPPWTIYTQTLIHDFDMLNWLNPGATAVEVMATDDALIAPDFKDQGLLDTAVVVIRYDNGAIATAEANFAATYGYDVRGEVFGSGGMVTIGEGARTSMRLHDGSGRHADTARGDTELLRDAYIGEFTEFVTAVQEARPPSVGGDEAWAAFAIAEAAVESSRTGARVQVARPVRPGQVH